MAGGIPTRTKAEQRIEHLINIGRPLTDQESDELYRALHADYMRKWRQERARRAEREIVRQAELGAQVEQSLFRRSAAKEAKAGSNKYLAALLEMVS